MEYIVSDYELFYTESKIDKELVDQVEINEKNKTYFYYVNVSYLCTDGYTEDGEPKESFYVSRYVFDCIIAGLKSNGFTQIQTQNTN